MLNIVWLEDFRALAATGNFSRAAEDRYMTQPAFSRRIRALEEWLGADLFDRSTQPAKLTAVGEWFRGVADELLARVARIPGEARIVAEASAVTLRIAATHALSFTFLPNWLHNLESKVPLGPVQLVSDVLQRCEALMLQSKVQFVLSHSHPQARGVLDLQAYPSVPIGQDLLIPFSAPDESGQPKYPLATSSTTPVLQYATESGTGRIIQAVIGRRLEPMAIRPAFTAHLASVLRTMALDGRGVAWLPQTLAEEDIAAGRLVPAAGMDWHIPVEIRLYRALAPMADAAEALWKAAAGSALPAAPSSLASR